MSNGFTFDGHVMDLIRQEALEFAGVGLLLCDRYGRVLSIDVGAQTILGLEDEYPDCSDIRGRNITEIALPDGPQDLLLKQAGSEDQARNVQFSIKTLKGMRKWIRFNAYPLENTRAGRKETLVILCDVTSKKEIESALQESEGRFRSIIQSSKDAIISIGDDGRIVVVNPAAEKMFGLDVNSMKKRPFDILIPEEDRSRLRQQFDHYLKSRDPELADDGPMELTAQRVDGQTFPIEISLSQAEYSERRTIIVIIRDISIRKRMEEYFRLAATVFEDSSDGVIITDCEGRVIMANKAVSSITGYSEEEIVGRDMEFLWSSENSEISYEDVLRSLTDEGEVREEIEGCRKNGETYTADLQVREMEESGDEAVGYVAVFKEIDEKKRADVYPDLDPHAYPGPDQHEGENARFDPLTRLPNRPLFMDRLERAIIHAKRDKQFVVMLFLDLDRFNNINNQGLDLGDRMLMETAQRLVSCVREDDTVARIGSDEFAIMLANATNEEDAGRSATRVAEKIQKALREVFVLDGNAQVITASTGISLFPNDGTEAGSLLKTAKQAMEFAQHKGRGRYQFYSTKINDSILRSISIENDLHHAIERNQLRICYQGLVNAKEGRIIGLEALLRWEHPRFGPLSPDQFIPVAEKSGLIVPIGEWVLRNACLQTRRWQQMGYPGVCMSVNIAVRQLEEQNLVGVVEAILKETDLAPEFLKLEITESALTSKMTKVREVLEGLKFLGVQVAIDDFGTGYSSLSRLSAFSLDSIKIDRSFIKGMLENDNNRTIVSSIIELAHNLDMTVTAEGVETVELAQALSDSQCDELQGFFFNRPVLASEIPALLGIDFF